MFLTLGNWLFIIIIGILAIGAIIGVAIAIFDDIKSIIITGLIATFIWFFVTIFGLNWYNTSTASGIRNYKDFQSELNNGIEREITIYAEDGRQIFHYEGKVDIESNHVDNYIKFESEDGKRYMIYYGIQDTIMIIEK